MKNTCNGDNGRKERSESSGAVIMTYVNRGTPSQEHGN